jgi:hypothetical protein
MAVQGNSDSGRDYRSHESECAGNVIGRHQELMQRAKDVDERSAVRCYELRW